MGMVEQTAKVLGEPVELTGIISPKGQGKRMMTVGVLGGVAGQLAADKIGNKKAPSLPGGQRSGYMVVALSPTKLAFFKMKRNLIRSSAGDLLEARPRDTVTRFELGGGALTSQLAVEFEDGTNYELEVPRAHKGKAEKIAAALKA
jgi:hypothetical protein